MNRREYQLDPRAWIVWGSAAALPPLLGRNPFPLIATTIAVIAVRAAWSPLMRSAIGWGALLRLALVFSVIGVAFNVLTVRAGDRVLATIPAAVPVLGGDDFTLNALIFGVLSGLALLLLVFIGTTVGGLLDWSAIVRMIPESLANVAVAGSIAFAFVPQTVLAFGEIREAQAARGHRFRGARDLAPVLAPLLAIGLERAFTLSESLESRGFGTPAPVPGRARMWRSACLAIALTAAATATYLFVAGRLPAAGLVLTAGLAAGAPAVIAGRRTHVRRTRYRALVWRPHDTLVVATSTVAALATLIASGANGPALRFDPYPVLHAPSVDLLLLAALLLLFVPAFVAPNARELSR